MGLLFVQGEIAPGELAEGGTYGANDGEDRAVFASGFGWWALAH